MDARKNVRFDDAVSRDLLDEIVRKIVEVTGPERIILFGSAARNERGPRSDLDLLVIKGGAYDHYRVLASIYRSLAEIDASIDVVLVTPEQAKRYANSFCLVIHPAVKEGAVVYEQATLGA